MYLDKSERDHLRAKGWSVTSINIPPQAKRIIDRMAHDAGVSRSTLLWRLAVSVWLKTHDAAGKCIEEVDESPDANRAARARAKGILEMSTAAARTIADQTWGGRKEPRVKPRIEERDGAAVGDVDEDSTTGEGEGEYE